MEALASETRTMIFYESPHRLLKTLEQLGDVFGPDRPGSVSRELTKLFEETVRGTLAELQTYFAAKPIKGEIVLCVGGRSEPPDQKRNKKGDDYYKQRSTDDDEEDDE
jgi:16S rRNA (cytidine1402-2'-O)-methyltransferase